MNPVMASSKTSDTGFFEQLTLGLSKVLTNTPRVTNVTCEKRQPCERSQIATWEQRHNVYLPNDMKRFYLSTDGFSFYWSYQYSPNDVRRVGYFNLPHLLQITLLRENVDSLHTTLQQQQQHMMGQNPATRTDPQQCPLPNSTGRMKIFELSHICDMGKVCLVYENLDLCNFKIYLLETRTLRLTFLADTFSEYLRMTVVHLGLPYWELCFSSSGLPPWTEQLFLLLAPHLLERSEIRRNKICNPTGEEQALYNNNFLDSSIFRNKKCTSNNNRHPLSTTKTSIK